MSKLVHNIYIAIMSLIVLFSFIYLAYYGKEYYGTSLEERYYNPNHSMLKASGTLGHGLGIVGTILILIGVFWYMARKRMRVFSRIGALKYWLEFHIFLCSLGPVLILFHTSFKFGGIVSISFWSMVAVVLSGVLGRFIYLQIPRTIQGRELSLNELREMRDGLVNTLMVNNDLKGIVIDELRITTETNTQKKDMISQWLSDRRQINHAKQKLKDNGMNKSQIKNVASILSEEYALNRRIDRLAYMQQLFKYWHVAHLPFAIVMLIIMVIHVIVTLMFGYKWIF